MTLRIPAKVLIHVWSYDFYDKTLSTGKQRRHMINEFLCLRFLTVTIVTYNSLYNGLLLFIFACIYLFVIPCILYFNMGRRLTNNNIFPQHLNS